MGSTEPTPVTWRGLNAAEPEVMAAASTEVEMYVRALAAYGVIVDRDAVPSELEDRQTTIRTKLWPGEPLDGYGLHASLGAYLVTKVAVDLVPTGHIGLRAEHLDAEGLKRALVEHGLSEPAARALAGDWPGEPEGFRGDAVGLSLSVLSGLAARTLTRDERNVALAQVAASPRDLARLAAAASLLEVVRSVLPLLPIPSLGPGYDLAVVGLTVGRGDRVAALLRDPVDVLQAALQELGAAMSTLSRGDPYGHELDLQVTFPAPLATDLWNDDTDSNAILDIVEEAGPMVAVCRWRHDSVAMADLETWQAQMRRWRSIDGTLGLRLPPAPRTALGGPVPPDAGLVAQSIGLGTADLTLPSDPQAPRFPWRGDPLDALAPVIRGGLRMVASAAEGYPPGTGALERAGDMAWLVRRATALAAVATGDVSSAIEVTEPLPAGAAPERRWAQDRARRYRDQPAGPAAPEDARQMGAALLGDLAQQLARTITRTLPEERHE